MTKNGTNQITVKMEKCRISENSGKIFDNTFKYYPNIEKCMKLIGHYFKEKEIKNKVVLDAGCRLGYNSYAFHINGSSKIIGVDLSKKCIKSAKGRFKENKNMHFYLGDVRNLKQFKDSYFDIVFCIGVIIYLSRDDMKMALKEFVRVTKPGGKILVNFQKEKSFIVRIITRFVNRISIMVFLKFIEIISFILTPLSGFILGRKVERDYLKYNVLLSMRGIHYGIPVFIPNKYLIKTPETELSSGKTTVTFKITVPRNKSKLLHEMSISD